MTRDEKKLLRLLIKGGMPRLFHRGPLFLFRRTVQALQWRDKPVGFIYRKIGSTQADEQLDFCWKYVHGTRKLSEFRSHPLYEVKVLYS